MSFNRKEHGLVLHDLRSFPLRPSVLYINSLWPQETESRALHNYFLTPFLSFPFRSLSLSLLSTGHNAAMTEKRTKIINIPPTRFEKANESVKEIFTAQTILTLVMTVRKEGGGQGYNLSSLFLQEMSSDVLKAWRYYRK